EIRRALGPGRAKEEAAGTAEEIAVDVVRLQIEDVVEQLDRRRVVEEPPAGEAHSRQGRDIVWRLREPQSVARKDDVLCVRVNREHERSHPLVIAHSVRVSPEEDRGLDAAAVALDFCRLRVDDAREFADRVFIPALVDEELALLWRAR